MHRTFGSVIALFALSPALLAEDEVSPWASLDDEVAALAQGDPTPGIVASAFMRVFIINYSNALADYSGVDLRHVQLSLANDRTNRRRNINRDSGRWDWLVRAQLDDGFTEIEEAWMRYRLCPHWAFGGGKFRGPVFEDLEKFWWETQMFDRTVLSQGFDSFDEGAWADYYGERFGATASVQNGNSGVASGHFYVMHFFMPFFSWLAPAADAGRMDFEWRETQRKMRQGQDELGALLGVSWVKDDSISDAEAVVAELRAAAGPWRGAVQVADLDEGVPFNYLTSRKSLASQLGVQMEPDTTPISATLSHQLQGSLRPTLAARVELLDDADDTRVTTLEGSVHKIPFLKFHGGLMDIASDDDSRDELIVYIGMSLVDPFTDGE